MAPSAPITITGTNSSEPSAAAVDAALRVVSPGKIGMTASRAIMRNTIRYVAAGRAGSTIVRPSLSAM